MKTTYLIWKDPSCNGINPCWQEITGKEYYALVNSPYGKDRYFIKIESVSDNGIDGRIVMETTKSEYVKWRKEKDHSDYIREQQQKSGYQTVSYHAMETDDKYSGEELLEDDGINIEAAVINSVEQELLKEALAQLTEDEYHLIEYFYLSGKKATVRGYSVITGIPYKTVHNRKAALLKKIKKIIEG